LRLRVVSTPDDARREKKQNQGRRRPPSRCVPGKKARTHHGINTGLGEAKQMNE
jgi:hypothetical protein